MKPVLIIFTRAPEPGRVKTRLMPFLSPGQCARLHDAFIRDIVEKFAGRKDLDLRIAFTPAGSEAYFSSYGIELIPQGGGDLGDRMARCLEQALSGGASKAVLIGTDVPHLSPDAVNDAFIKLDDYDLVFGPAEDGGYYLVGARERLPVGLFKNVNWSSPETLAQTLERARDIGASAARIQEYFDVDTPEDLERLTALEPGPHTRDCLGKPGDLHPLRSSRGRISSR